MNMIIASFFILALNLSLSAFAKTDSYSLYITADFSYNKESALSIEKGVYTALSEQDFKVGGFDIDIVTCDHRGLTTRSEACIEKILDDPKALAMFTGLHSPPLISNLLSKGSSTNINENKLLTLDPWAAAGIITRASEDNWVYRLSVDDKYAGEFIVDYTLSEGYKNIAFLLVNDGWGNYNRTKMVERLSMSGLKPSQIIMFDRDLTPDLAMVHLLDISQNPTDAIILVANAPQGESIFEAMNALDLHRKIAVRSHWGIAGGYLWRNTKSIVNEMNLKIIQTSFNFHVETLNSHQTYVFSKAQKIYPELKTYSDLKAQVGFVHAYDLTRILQQAISQKVLTGNLMQDRINIRHSLENLEKPVKGLIRDYTNPFEAYSSEQPDAHEALGRQDFRMSSYDELGNLIILD